MNLGELSGEELDVLYSACFALDKKLFELISACNDAMLMEPIGALARNQRIVQELRRRIEVAKVRGPNKEAP